MYQVSFNSLLYFQRYAPDKLFIAKIKKRSNSVNIGDRVMILAFCNSPHESSFIKLSSILSEIYFGQKCDGRMDGQTDGQNSDYAPFGEHKNQSTGGLFLSAGWEKLS